MIDEDDVWMNPGTHFATKSPPPKNGTFYQIQRKKRIPVSGNVAFLEEWREWEEFESKEDRDKELARLRKETSWHVRGRVAVYINGRQMPGNDPTEYMDF